MNVAHGCKHIKCNSYDQAWVLAENNCVAVSVPVLQLVNPWEACTTNWMCPVYLKLSSYEAINRNLMRRWIFTPSTRGQWLRIAAGFNKWNYPNYIGKYMCSLYHYKISVSPPGMQLWAFYGYQLTRTDTSQTQNTNRGGAGGGGGKKKHKKYR